VASLVFNTSAAGDPRRVGSIPATSATEFAPCTQLRKLCCGTVGESVQRVRFIAFNLQRSTTSDRQRDRRWSSAGLRRQAKPVRIDGCSGSDAANPMAAWSVISAMGRAGDEHAEAVIRDFLDRGHAGLVRAVTAMTGDRESAHDLVQEAVVRAWERIARGEDIRSVDGWIATAALNLARTSLRRRTVRTRVERRLTDSLHVAAQQRAGLGDGVANTSVVSAALRALPWRQRQVTVMRYFLGMDVGEIADQLGISDGTVKAALFRARAVLRPLLADAFDHTEEEVQRGR